LPIKRNTGCPKGKAVCKRKKDICLVSGEKDKIAALHNPLRVFGAKTSGANIVSFNLDPFQSFNKKQGENAPIGESSMFAYNYGTSIHY